MADAMYMNFAEIIKQVSQDKRLVPDLMKAEMAIILELLVSPLFWMLLVLF